MSLLRKKKSQIGFTLLELLVTVSILAILAGLLIPVLSRSREAAKRIQCVQNLRQLHVASQFYWEDNRSEAFRFRGTSTNGGEVFWFGWLQRGAEGARTYDFTPSPLFPYLGSKQAGLCPSFTVVSIPYKPKAKGSTIAYGYNLHLSSPASSPPVRISAIKNPSGTALFADAAQVNTFQAPASVDHPMVEEFYYVNDQEPTAHFRHQARLSAVFCDGHAAKENPVPGSMDQRIPAARIGRLRPEILDWKKENR